jgi:hypothetical protein
LAIIVTCPDPSGLLSAIKSAISEGLVTTWECDDEDDFTHSSSRWKYRAWLRPIVEDETLTLTIVAPRETTINVTVYAAYHARFIEMLLEHFDKLFEGVECTALASLGDDLGDT